MMMQESLHVNVNGSFVRAVRPANRAAWTNFGRVTFKVSKKTCVQKFMIATHLSERIRTRLDQMGEGARAIAEFAMTRSEDMALLPAAQVAQRLGLSESTVTRFAVLLGYDGYPAFRKELQNELRRHLAPPQRLQLESKVAKGQSPVRGVFEQDVENILRTERDLTAAHLEQCCHVISSARRIYVVGLRASFGLAHSLYFQLDQMLGNVMLVDAPRGSALDQLRGIDVQDLVIVISFPRHPALTVAALKYARTRQAKAIAISDGPLSPIASDVDLLLTVSTSVGRVYTSLVGAFSLINALCSELAVRNRKRVSANLAAVEEALKSAGPFN